MPILLLGVATGISAAEAGKADIFAQGGYYTELGQGGGSWAMVGGGAGFGLNRHLALFGEFNYVRPSIKLGDVSATGDLYQAGVGARVFLPGHNEHVRLYLPAVGGVLRGKSAIAVNGSKYARGWATGAYVGSGLGAEIPVTKRFGLRPEFRYFREFWRPEFGPSSQNNGLRFMMGLYYRPGAH